MLKGYRTILVGLAMAILPAGLTYLAGVDWSAMFGPATAFFISGIITVAMRFFTTTPPGKSAEQVAIDFQAGRMIAIAAIGGGLMVMLSGLAARAADLAAKSAPAAADFQYPAGDGFYFGVGTIGGGGSVDASVTGVNASSLNANQIGVAGIVGYAWNIPGSSKFVAVEGWAGYNNFNGAQPGLSFSGPAMLKERLLIGAPLADIVAFFPSLGLQVPTFPALPAGQAITSVKSYIAGSANEDDITIDVAGVGSNRDWRITPSISLGLLAQLTSGSVLDAFVEYKFQTKAICVGSGAAIGCGKLGDQVLGGLALKW